MDKKQHDRPKRGLKLFFLPKIQGQKHKHKKNKYYFGQDHDDDHEGSIMSGDSPAHHNRTAEIFDYHPATSTLTIEPNKSGSIATTSKEGDKNKVEVQASAVIVEPGGDNEEDKDNFASPTLNNGDSKGEKHVDGDGDSGKFDGGDREDRERKGEKFRKNGNLDKLDGVWVPNNNKPKGDGEEEEDCLVKCLYWTITCCECSIM